MGLRQGLGTGESHGTAWECVGLVRKAHSDDEAIERRIGQILGIAVPPDIARTG